MSLARTHSRGYLPEVGYCNWVAPRGMINEGQEQRRCWFTRVGFLRPRIRQLTPPATRHLSTSIFTIANLSMLVTETGNLSILDSLDRGVIDSILRDLRFIAAGDSDQRKLSIVTLEVRYGRTEHSFVPVPLVRSSFGFLVLDISQYRPLQVENSSYRFSQLIVYVSWYLLISASEAWKFCFLEFVKKFSKPYLA